MGNGFDQMNSELNWTIFKHEEYYRHTFTNLSELTQGVTRSIHRHQAKKRYSKMADIKSLDYKVG